MSLTEFSDERNHKKGPYFPLYYRDFVDACRDAKMTAEEVGALVIVMCQQWSRQGAIPDADRFAAYSGWNIRICRRLLSRLIGLDKVVERTDGYHSPRMSFEITRYCAKVKAAEDREARKREERNPAPNLAKSGEDLANSANSQPTLAPKLSEIANEINKTVTKKSTYTDTDTDTDRKEERNKDESADALSPSLQKILDAYNNVAKQVGIPAATKLTSARVRAVKMRLKEFGDDSWKVVLVNIASSAFLQGDNNRNWRAPGLDWFLKSENYAKVFEGAYRNGSKIKVTGLDFGIVVDRDPGPKETPQERSDRLWRQQEAEEAERRGVVQPKTAVADLFGSLSDLINQEAF